MHVAKAAFIQQALHLAEMRHEAKVLVDGKRNSSGFSDARDGQRLGMRVAEWFLADRCDAAAGGLRYVLAVRGRRRHDIEDVGFAPLEHRTDRAEHHRDAEAGRQRVRLHRVAIADRDNLDARNPLPAIQLELAEISGPGNRNAQLLHG